jgi:excisionase family DNA binding protein
LIGQQYLSSEEAAVYLGISVKTVRDWRHKGQGPPSYKLGGLVRYDLRELDAWVKAQGEGASARSRPGQDRLHEQRIRRGTA